MCRCLCHCIFSTQLPKYLEVLLLYLRKTVYFYKKTPKYLPKWLNHFAVPQVLSERPCCSVFLPASGVASILDFSHSESCVVVSYYFNLQLSNDIWCWVSILSYAYFSSVYLFWWGMYSDILSILKLSCFLIVEF